MWSPTFRVALLVAIAGCGTGPAVHGEIVALRRETNAFLSRIEERLTALEKALADPRLHRAGAPVDWTRITGGGPFVVHCGPRHKADAMKFYGWMQEAVIAFREELAGHDVRALLSGIDCRVWLHPQPGDDARPGFAHTGRGVRDGRYYADIHLLTPAAHGPGGVTVVNEPYDDVYHRKTLVHEYAHVLLDRLARTKRKGWKLYTAPRWFREGYAEYLSLMRSSKQSREQTLPKYVADAKAHPDRVKPGFEVERPYVDGAVILLFLHETFGKGRIQAVVTSEAGTFAKAVADSVGRDLVALHADWRRWLDTR